MTDKTPFKFKYGGMTMIARRMMPDEIIDKKSLCRHRDFSRGTEGGWHASGCVGERVDEHPDWEYIIVISKFFQGESIERYSSC